MQEEITMEQSIKKEHSIVSTIKMLCENNNTSIPKLEKELGFGNGAIYNWDKCSPSANKIIKVAIYFGVSSDFILGLVC